MAASTLNLFAGLIPRMPSVTLQDRVCEAVKAAQKAGKTMAEVARAAGVTQAALTLLMNGSTKSLKGSTATGLQDATGFRAEYLVKGSLPKKMQAPGAGHALSQEALIVARELDRIADDSERASKMAAAIQAIKGGSSGERDGPTIPATSGVGT